MADEPREAENTVEDTTATESPAADNQTRDNQPTDTNHTEDATDTQEESAQDDSADGESKDVEKPAKRDRSAQGRIRELINKNKQLQGQMSTGQQQQLQRQMQNASPQQLQKFSDMVAGREDITPGELDDLAAQYFEGFRNQILNESRAYVDLTLQQQQRAAQIDTDVSIVEKTYDELNPESDHYDAELDERIANMYLRSDKSQSLKEFTDDIMSLRSKGIERGRASDREVLSQQADETSITPNQRSKPEKTVEEKSLSELRKELGYVEY